MADNTGADILRQRTEHLYAHEGMPWSDAEAQARAEHPELNTTTPEAPTVQSGVSMSVRLRSYADIDDDVPTWVWTYGDHGRIPLGALTLFAGRPAAGKSTAARWFAAQVTRGTLPGEWHGTPHSVAYIAAEESLKFSVKPSLRAAGADMKRVKYPELITRTEDIDEARVNYIPTAAMSMFAKVLRDADVKLVIVDPLMTMLGGGTDIYRNNEVRERVQPWVDLADQIGGVVIGITHLNKSVTGDVLAAINGSSAFGELCRAAFGFANDIEAEDQTRVMSQVKNSLGVEDLSLTYSLTPEMVTTASGRSAEMPRFTILGESDRKVGEILRAAAAPIDRDGDDSDEVKDIVLDVLEANGGSAPAGDVLKVTRAAGISDKTVKNRRKKLGVQTKKTVNGWVWTIDQGPTTSPVQREVGTLGPSSSEGVSKVPEESRSLGPMYTREGRDLAPEQSHLSVVPDSDDPVRAAILDALDDTGEVGLSEGALMKTIRELTGSGATVPDVLDEMKKAGTVHVESGRYFKAGAAA